MTGISALGRFVVISVTVIVIGGLAGSSIFVVACFLFEGGCKRRGSVTGCSTKFLVA